MRQTLAQPKVHPQAQQAIASFHSTIVKEVEDAIQKNDWVVVGMKMNPVVSSARKLLKEKGIKYEYLEYGGYTSMWKERLAIKLWSGWPTFPQVFHKGVLIGGFKDLQVYQI